MELLKIVWNHLCASFQDMKGQDEARLSVYVCSIINYAHPGAQLVNVRHITRNQGTCKGTVDIVLPIPCAAVIHTRYSIPLHHIKLQTDLHAMFRSLPKLKGISSGRSERLKRTAPCTQSRVSQEVPEKQQRVGSPDDESPSIHQSDYSSSLYSPISSPENF